jgi:hypothetical protein
MNNFWASNEALSYISDMMKEQDENHFNGLSRGQVKQIIRRNMVTRVKASKKVYDRKKERKNLES